MLGQRSTSMAEMMTSETSSRYSIEIRNENTTHYGDANENIVTAAEGESTVPFTMCGRTAPFKHDIHQFHVDWPRDNKILLLRNDGKFGHMGNQINSLLHSFDYARDHRLDLGILFHSWAMDAIHTMFYETSDFEALGRELRRDLGILSVRNQTMLAGYDEVISKNSQKLYFYQSANVGVNHWTETMYVHAAFLQRLFLRYNQGYGYVHNGLRAADVCTTLNMFFRERASEAKYTVIHSRYLDGNAEWRLEKMAKTTKITVEGGALYMSPGYVKAILRPLGMLEHPIILLSDGQLPSVERGLLNDPIIGPNLMVLSHKDSLDGADVALAVLADVFIGNPASITSGFVARSRYGGTAYATRNASSIHGCWVNGFETILCHIYPTQMKEVHGCGPLVYKPTAFYTT
mmetsp:Transcript_39968/g.86169  ORF Transcript_39968/g.86169 Transcript_39968/m.86169 type:complete len:404 (+) Transcript_39968:59-1270(+)